MFISVISVVTETYVIIEINTRAVSMKLEKFSKLLIIGGYGNFGGRLAGLLADFPELTLFIAGRSLHKAKRFVAANGGPATMIPVEFDRDGNVSEQIKKLRPQVVIDASGPYQAYGNRPYRVAEAAISVGAHYLDLADGTDFVLNISSVNDDAMTENVFVLSGASTCTVLTSAVARHLSSDFIRVDSVAGGVSPSPYAGLGKSVARAVAQYAGKPVTVWRDGELVSDIAFTSTSRFTITPPGYLPMPPMTFGLIDVPDLQLLADIDKTVGNTWFGVAATPTLYPTLFRILARAVERGVLPSLARIAGFMHFVMNRISWGEHRGGMFMEVSGTDLRGRDTRRSWHLIAEGDDGPTVPVLAAYLIIRNCLDGHFPRAGARPAKDVLNLADYDSMFERLNIRTGERSALPDASLFHSILGDAWQTISEPIRELHDVNVTSRFSGRASVSRGIGILGRIVGWLVGFPKAGNDIPVTVRISQDGLNETWTRKFGEHAFSSELSPGSGRFEALICERFGHCKFGMALVTEGENLNYVSRRWTLFGVPMPKWMMPKGEMYETVVDGKFLFHVEIVLPLIGHVVTYEGWLERSDQTFSSS